MAAKLRRWIDEGAKYESHWAYTVPKRPAVPEPPDQSAAGWSRGAIDRFVAAAHAQHNLHPSPDADPRTLLRRLRLDLTGLPPSPDESDAFAADHSPAAYEKTADRLLACPQFGERMAVYWLDVVRYADTAGYHSDNERSVWLYRDYVVNAFNENKPFDRFTIEQLAGDLLPGATREQKIASGYNRLLQTTEEGGAQAKEYTAKYAADRVRNTATAFLGSTMGCCQCHDHKYDPFTAKDFYSFAAFFADVREKAIQRQDQTPMPTPEQAARLKEFDGQIAAATKELAAATADVPASQGEWEKLAKSANGKQKLPANVVAALKTAPADRTTNEANLLKKYYAGKVAAKSPLLKKIEQLRARESTIRKHDSLDTHYHSRSAAHGAHPRPRQLAGR